VISSGILEIPSVIFCDLSRHSLNFTQSFLGFAHPFLSSSTSSPNPCCSIGGMRARWGEQASDIRMEQRQWEAYRIRATTTGGAPDRSGGDRWGACGVDGQGCACQRMHGAHEAGRLGRAGWLGTWRLADAGTGLGRGTLGGLLVGWTLDSGVGPPDSSS
jgi:hypothetical protein